MRARSSLPSSRPQEMPTTSNCASVMPLKQFRDQIRHRVLPEISGQITEAGFARPGRGCARGNAGGSATAIFGGRPGGRRRAAPPATTERASSVEGVPERRLRPDRLSALVPRHRDSRTNRRYCAFRGTKLANASASSGSSATARSKQAMASFELSLTFQGIAEVAVRLGVSRVQIQRPPIARYPPHRAAQASARISAEVAMGLRLIRRQLDGPAQRGLRLGKALEAHQRGGAVDMRPEEVRDQLDGTPGTLQPRFEQALIIERAGEIAVRHAIIRVERDRPPIAVRCLGLAGPPPVMRCRGSDALPAGHPIPGARALISSIADGNFPLLIGDEPEKVQRLGMLRVCFQRLPIQCLRLLKLPGLVVGKAGVHHVFAALRDHDQRRLSSSDSNNTLLYCGARWACRPASVRSQAPRAELKAALLFGSSVFFTQLVQALLSSNAAPDVAQTMARAVFRSSLRKKGFFFFFFYCAASKRGVGMFYTCSGLGVRHYPLKSTDFNVEVTRTNLEKNCRKSLHLSSAHF